MFKCVLVGLVATAAYGLGFAEPPPNGSDQTHGASGERVGNFCVPERIHFEGAKTYSAESLRFGLERTFDFREVSHPFAPLADYLAAIQARVRTGYQHGGFPDATVAVDRDEVSTQIVVKVQEGPRYFCGPVKVKGLKSIDPKRMVRCLSAPAEQGRKKQSALVMESDDKTAQNGQQNSDEEAWDPYLWTPGSPAHLSDASLHTLGVLVSNVFWEFGFAGPRFAIHAARDEKTHLAELTVDVQDEGPRAFIDRLEISGLRKNTRESLLKYLKIKPGQPLTSNLISQVESKLWEAARFLHYEVEVGKPDDRGASEVKISVLEYKDAPPLNKDFSPVEKAMLRARQWWASPERGRGGMLFTGSVSNWQEMTFALGVSAERGMAFAARHGGNAATGGEWGMVLATNLVGLYPPEGRPELAIPDFAGRVKLQLSLTGSTNAEEPFNGTFAAGYNTTNDSPVPLCQLHLTLAPVALIGMAHKKGWTNHFERGKWVASSTDGSVEVDDRTGRFSVRGGPGTNGFAYQLTFATNAFEEVEARLLAARDHGTNRYDCAKPLGSFASIAIEELLRSQLMQGLVLTNLTGEKRIHAAKVTSALFSKVALAPLDRLIQQQQSDTSDDTDAFVIPEVQSMSGTVQSEVIKRVAYWVLMFSDKFFPVGSWPWTLLRETTFVVQGQSRYAGAALNEVYSSDETGPLGYLAAAELLKLGHLPSAPVFATRGLEELTSWDFGHDARLLFNGDGVVPQSFVNLAETLRDMDDGDLEYLASLLPPARAEFIRQAVAAMRAAKGRPTYEVLAPALNAYWQSELKQQVAAALKAVAAQK